MLLFKIIANLFFHGQYTHYITFKKKLWKVSKLVYRGLILFISHFSHNNCHKKPNLHLKTMVVHCRTTLYMKWRFSNNAHVYCNNSLHIINNTVSKALFLIEPL